MPTLGVEGVLPLLVLRDFVRLVLATFLAVGPTGFWDVHLGAQGEIRSAQPPTAHGDGERPLHARGFSCPAAAGRSPPARSFPSPPGGPAPPPRAYGLPPPPRPVLAASQASIAAACASGGQSERPPARMSADAASPLRQHSPSWRRRPEEKGQLGSGSRRKRRDHREERGQGSGRAGTGRAAPSSGGRARRRPRRRWGWYERIAAIGKAL